MSPLRAASAALFVTAVVVAAAAQDAGTAPAPAAAPAAPPSAGLLPTPDPPAAAPPFGQPQGIFPSPAPPGPPTLFSYLGLSAQQREFRQQQQATIPFGKVREKIQTPLSKLTGGLIKPFPPKVPTLAQLKAPGPVGAAAKVKLDKAGVEGRKKAVEELAKVDCHYWPEAEGRRSGAPRADRNSCVREAAAKALEGGCCCTKKTITALSIAASCADTDGNPSEKCKKVVEAARKSLKKCLERACAATQCPVCPPPAADRPERPKEDPNELDPVAASKPGPGGFEKPGPGRLAPPTVTGKEYYDRVGKRPWPEIIASAGKVAARDLPIPAELLLTGDDEDDAEPAASAAPHSPRPVSLLDLAVEAAKAPPAPPEPPPAPPATPPEPRPTNLYDRFFGGTKSEPAKPAPPPAPPAPVPATPPTPVRPEMRVVEVSPPAKPLPPVAPPATPAPVVAAVTPASARPRFFDTPPPQKPAAPVEVAPAPTVPILAPPAVAFAPAVPAEKPAVPVVSAPPVPERREPPAAKFVLPATPVPPLALFGPLAEVTPPPAPAPPAADAPKPSPLARRVVYVLGRFVDPGYVEEQVGRLTADDAASFPALLPAVSDAANNHTSPEVRAACARALERIAKARASAPKPPAAAASAKQAPAPGLVRLAGFRSPR